MSQTSELREGQDVYLFPHKDRPDWRIRGKIVKVRRYQLTVLYDTDIWWPQDEQGQTKPGHRQTPCGGLSRHWLQPVDVVTLLAETG